MSHHVTKADPVVPRRRDGPAYARRPGKALARTDAGDGAERKRPERRRSGGRDEVRRLGYKLGLIGNAERQDYPVSLVMYRPGLRPEALKFAKTMHVRTVGPLDGIPGSALGRAKLVYIVGAT